MPGTHEEYVHSPNGELADFRAVPAADAAAEVDPHWLALRGPSDLPTTYMPPAMPGARPPWLRAVAALLIAVFVAATAIGVCLTYGAPMLGW